MGNINVPWSQAQKKSLLVEIQGVAGVTRDWEPAIWWVQLRSQSPDCIQLAAQRTPGNAQCSYKYQTQRAAA